MPTSYTAGNYPQYVGAGMLVYDASLTAATGTTAGGVLALLNPWGIDVIITDAYIDVTTAATTATNTMDVGIAANGTTSNDTLFDGQVTSAGVKTPGGTNGLVPRKLTSTQYITATASATLVGMVATLKIIAVRA